MFRKAKDIDTAFRQVRQVAMLVIVGCTLICGAIIHKSFSLVAGMQDRVYVLASGKALEAFASNRKDNVPVEARDHIKMFHQWFFTLDPDDKAIREHITKALYLADVSAKRQYDNLKEQGYYTGIISGNISQAIVVDSVRVNVNDYPYRFYCYATQELVRATSTVTRSLVTEGVLRNVSRSDHNPHGFLIERWKIIENRDLKTQNRR